MFEEEGFTDIETAAFERSLSAPPVQGYSFSVSDQYQIHLIAFIHYTFVNPTIFYLVVAATT
jgi:hypothetical protein